MGGFEAITRAFFDTSPLFGEESYINFRFPFRVGFKQVVDYPRLIHVNEIWAGRDVGQIWTMQQARGDVVGRHACWPLTLSEGNLLLRMLNELNLITNPPYINTNPPDNLHPLPIDYSLEGVRYPHLHYEATLQSIILNGLADEMWKETFGDYDDFLPFVSTSEGKEIDIVLLKHNNQGKIIWYQILELKRDRYRFEDLLQILSYETWLTSNQAAGNPRSVHMVALANRFDEDVVNNARDRYRLNQKPVRLIEYEFNEDENDLHFNIVDVS